MAGRFDAIVVGLGAHGSAAMYHLAKWGSRVLGLDRWHPGHDNASHHGSTRITRQCYAEGAMYVPLLLKSFELYRALERETRQPLFCRTGVLNVGQPLVEGAHAAAVEHGLPHELMSKEQVEERFPGISLPPGTPCLFEAAGGILRPEAMVAAHCCEAARHGAAIKTRERVLGWEALSDGGVRVSTDAGATYEADSLVLAPGAWIPKMVPELEGLVVPQRVTVGWFQTSDPALYSPGSFPVWLLQLPGGYPFYGFPEFEGQPGFKIGAFTPPGEAACDPDALDRLWRGEEDERPLREAVKAFFPAADGPLLKGSVCMFSNTPDHNFIIDTHPRHPQVILCSACSGHGFKLSPAVGLVLAEMVRHRGRSPTFDREVQGFRLQPGREGHAEALRRFRGSS